MIGLLVALGAAPAAADERVGDNPLVSVDRAIDKTPRRALVTQRLVAGPYTYLLVDLADDGEPEEHWVVSMRTGLEEGMEVTISPIGRKRDFHSARLDRTFGELWFAAVRVLE